MDYSNQVKRDADSLVEAFYARHGDRFPLDSMTLRCLASILDGAAHTRTVTIKRTGDRTTLSVANTEYEGDTLLGVIEQMVAAEATRHEPKH